MSDPKTGNESPEKNLNVPEELLADWTPDTGPAIVTLVQDPFAIDTQDITDAQNSTDELDLDNDLKDFEIDAAAVAASEETLSRLESAMAEESVRLEKELESLQIETPEDAATRLAAEIAEDEALQKLLAEEAELAEQIDPELAAALPSLPVADENGVLDLTEMQSCLETLLFMSDKPVSAVKLQELLGPDFPPNVFQEALTLLKDKYQHASHGFELAEVAGGFQFRTKPGRAALAKKLARIQVQRLSSGAMETLAIIAYKQPALKDDVDKIRGVDSSHFIRTLLDRKLIAITGRSELVGRPMVYETTPEFLELFGLKELSAMPSLRELEQMVPNSQSGNPDDEDPRVKEMRRLVAQMKSDGSTRLVYDPKEDEKILSEIRTKVNAIPTSTPWLDEQRAMEKEAAEAAKAAKLAPVVEESGQIVLPTELPLAEAPVEQV